MVKVATWNVNSIAVRLDALLGFLARHQPDLVCLQELKCLEEKFPYAALRDVGYHAAVLGQKTYNGVAVLTREPAVPVASNFADGVDDAAARFIGVRAAGITCYSAYVPNGQSVGTDKYFYKLNWLARLRRFLDREHRPDELILVGGDYNVAPDDRDVYDPAAWRDKLLCSAREREALNYVADFGLADAYRKLHPDETQYTWWDFRTFAFQRNHGVRIDLLLTSAPLTAALRSCSVDRSEREREKPSDHAPVLAEFELPRP